MKSPMHLVLVALLLLASGAAGLSYEVVWLRMLSNVLGSSSAATATVLAVFMGGMAAGALALGRIVDRTSRPLAVYAVLEAALAVCALVLPWCLGMVARLDAALDGDGSAVVSKALSAAVILFVPTFVMGGTLPAMIAHMARRGWHGGRAFGLLYGIHVLGAAGGALTASFVMIGELGLRTTCMVGAAVNAAVAIGAWALSRVPHPDGASTSPTPVVAAEAPTRLRQLPMMATAFLGGFVLLASEVVYVRTLVLALQAKVHSFALMLSTFLVGLSLGSLIVSLLPIRWIRGGGAALGWALVLGAGGLLVSREVPLQWALPFLLGGADFPDIQATGLIAGLVDLVSNDYAEIQPKEYLRICIALSALTILPCAIPAGMVFPLLLRRTALRDENPGRRGGQLVFWNTMGAVAGPVVGAYLFIPRFGLQGSLWMFALALGTAGIAWWAAGRPQASRPGIAVSAVFAVGLVVALVVSPRRFEGTPELDVTMRGETVFTGRAVPRVLRHIEGSGGTVTVIEDENERRALRLNGFEAAGMAVENVSFYHYMRLMGHLPVLMRGPSEVKRALIICCGTGSTAGSLSIHEHVEADLVDLHREVLDCLPLFERWNHGLATNPRCRQIADDGRAHLRRHEDEFDVITLEPMPPRYAGMTQLYSVEFYESCVSALREGGIVCQWLPLHLMSYEDGLRAVRAMADVFEHVQVWHHQNTFLLLGSQSPLTIRKANYDALMQVPQAAADFAAAQLAQPLQLLDSYFCDADELAGHLDPLDPIVDDLPDLEYSRVEYGLTRIKPAAMRRAAAPYLEARRDAALPAEGFGDGLGIGWRRLGAMHWLRHLIADDRKADAEAYFDALKREDGFFGSNPQFRRMMEQLRAR